jgi:superfamily II DNA or RNA helicase
MSKKCFITLRDEVFCTISNLSPPDLDQLIEKYSVFVDGYFFMPAYKLGRWDGKKRFFDRTGKTFIRFLDKIVEFLAGRGYDFELIDKRAPIKPIALRADVNQFIDKGIELRPYQLECVNRLIDEGSGFIVAGTGAGKSLICASLCDIYGKSGYRTITVVPSSDLVTQTAEWYVTCGMDAGEYSGNTKDIDRTHVVATWQSLQNNPHLITLFNMFIIDEAHGTKGNVIYDLITEHGKGIPFRFGVTGTFPKPLADQLTLKSTIGEIHKTITARWLIDNGYLAEVEIEPTIIEVAVEEEFPDYASETSYLSKNAERLDVLADFIINKCEKHGNTLVLVNSVKTGELLQSMIADSVFLYGANDKKSRKEQYDLYANRNDLITIATFGIASTGISIDRIFCLVLVDAGKSFIRAIQSVGRGTRLAKDKNLINVFDVYSNLKWSKKHANDRKKYYKEAEYIINPNVKIKRKKK